MLPLLRHYAPGAAVVWTGRAIGPHRFLLLARHIAATLPPDRQIVNLCEDRYYFLLAFAAALIAGRLTLTPASRAAEAMSGIERTCSDSYAVNDSLIAALLEDGAMHTLDGTSDLPFDVPLIPADQPAITLFTSGSSGQPTAHCKTWGMLVQGADQLQRAFGVAPGACVLGTVPPQHMFGLESTIVFPLQWGCTIHRQRPLLPADIEHALAQCAAAAPIWLMTTPLHLRACVDEGAAMHGIAAAISATMPLDQSAARDAERVLQCPVHEIYGCTEAGMTATRRPALEMEWRLCPDFRLRVEDGQAWLDGDRLGRGPAQAAQSLALPDRVVMHTPERFSLHGRSGDMLKIAGKRTSLAALNAALLAIDGVGDGCFFVPGAADGVSNKGSERLSAFVVAPQMSERQLMAALRLRIDAAFLPRPLWKVAQLPRDANGKLPHAALAELAASLRARDAAPAPHVDDQAVEHGDDRTDHQTSSVIAADHPALDGHFDGNAIVPGVLLLSEVVQLAARRFRIVGIRQVKFHAPLRPGQEYAINLEPAPPLTVKFAIRHGQATIASGVLQCADPDGV